MMALSLKFEVCGLWFAVCGSSLRGTKQSLFGLRNNIVTSVTIPQRKIASCLAMTSLLITLFTACGNDDQTKQFAEKQSHLSDNLVNAHKQFVKDESKEIDDFIARHNYEMQKSATGLRYKIESDNKGEKAESGDVVILKYDIYLLNGTLCYSSDSVGLMSFKVEEGEVPNGIHEAVQLMRKGDKAQLVLPVHLAYGLSGDQNKIPMESTIYCTLELKDIKRKTK
ncbi:MAG: FKBP-type peptidyl-prolyl cis-trans isomerase [Bacteroidia bacterium]